mmetsp:Transcript_7135/g.26244  ORF Transcript_7135/g.26244 Transcript_7135/m.26244 type:complete len:405 (-) Transcript_7135:2247-3461(-)
MFRSLYSDLPPSKDEAEAKAKAASSGAKAKPTTTAQLFTPSSLTSSKLAAPRTTFATPAALLKKRETSEPPKPRSAIVKSPALVTPQPPPTKPADTPSAAVDVAVNTSATPIPTTVKQGANAFEVADEYDPSRPNDYEIACERREALRKKQQMEAEAQQQAKKAREASQASGARDAESDRERKLRLLNMSGEEAFRRRAGLASASSGPSTGAQASASSMPAPAAPQSSPKPMSAAERMMAKMGWSEGQGLGKHGQGISTALQHKKTDVRSGVIVNAHEERKKSMTVAGVEPTRVVLLSNMVGPGEVDEELREEVAEECAKYGKVDGVNVFEIQDKSCPPTEAVRIFVYFAAIDGAFKAQADLNGRFFGGRVVRAAFFSEERYRKGQLAPEGAELSSIFGSVGQS